MRVRAMFFVAPLRRNEVEQENSCRPFKLINSRCFFFTRKQRDDALNYVTWNLIKSLFLLHLLSSSFSRKQFKANEWLNLEAADRDERSVLRIYELKSNWRIFNFLYLSPELPAAVWKRLSLVEFIITVWNFRGSAHATINYEALTIIGTMKDFVCKSRWHFELIFCSSKRDFSLLSA